MLSNISFRPSVSRIFDIVYFFHADSALELVKPLSLVSAVNRAHRYLPNQAALLLTTANFHLFNTAVPCPAFPNRGNTFACILYSR